MVMYQERQRFIFFNECFNSLAFSKTKYSYPITTVIFILTCSFQPIYLLGLKEQISGYYIVLSFFVVLTLSTAHVF